MNINQVFSGNFLKADDLQGRTVPVTISKVELKEFEDGNKLVISFQGKDKSLVCNKTNASILAEVCGSPDTDNWIGRTVKLCVKKVEYAGKLVPAIRVVLEDAALAKPVSRPAPAPAPVADPARDDEGFDAHNDDSVPF